MTTQKLSAFVWVASVAAATLLCSHQASAQSAGQWMLQGGFTTISPHVDSGDLSAPAFPGTQADVHSATSLTGAVTYMVRDNMSVSVPLALPFKHKIVGDGAIAGVGKLGEVKSLPMTVFAQYRFLTPDAVFRPYVGLGLTYAKFFKARSTAALTGLTGGSPSDPTTLKVDSKFAATAQIGATYALSPRWFIDAQATYTPLKTTTQLSTGQTLDIELDPTSVALAVGYKF